MRGASLSNSGPGDSFSISERPPAESRGRIASASTMMPMPPSHWVRLRQKRMPRPWLEMSRHDARAGGREAAHGLEVGVDRAGRCRRPRRCTAARRAPAADEPGQRRRRGTPSRRPISGAAARQPLDAEADRDADRQRDQERRERLAVPERDAGRREQRQREPRRHQRDEVHRRADVDEDRSPPPRPHGSRGHSVRSSSATRLVSATMIARSPACSTSSPRGKITCSPRMMAPTMAPCSGRSRKGRPMQRAVRR